MIFNENSAWAPEGLGGGGGVVINTFAFGKCVREHLQLGGDKHICQNVRI